MGFADSIAAIGQRVKNDKAMVIAKEEEIRTKQEEKPEPWKENEASFKEYFDISYSDFCKLADALPGKMTKYEKIRSADEEAAILWLIHEGKNKGLLKVTT